jgi:pimeloyl-ACP methyl ester carboxylesterase
MSRLLTFLLLIICISAAFTQPAFHIEKIGAGRPIILLPGFTTPGSVWESTIKGLEGPFQTHAVSYAGFGGIVPIATPWYDQIKTQLANYIRENNIRNLVLIGHSMGGNLAIDLAAELPEHISGLILVESIPCMREMMMPGVPASSLQYDSPYNNQVLQMNDDAFKQMATGMSQNMTFNQSKVPLLVEWSMKADRKTYVYGYTDLLKLDLRDALKNISINTLILGASFPDKNMILSTYEKQYANLQSKEILIADNSKHFIMFDQPDWLQKNINVYLKVNGKK